MSSTGDGKGLAQSKSGRLERSLDSADPAATSLPLPPSPVLRVQQSLTAGRGSVRPPGPAGSYTRFAPEHWQWRLEEGRYEDEAACSHTSPGLVNEQGSLLLYHLFQQSVQGAPHTVRMCVCGGEMSRTHAETVFGGGCAARTRSQCLWAHVSRIFFFSS